VKTAFRGSLAILLLIGIALLSVADRTGVTWMAARAAGFVGILALANRHSHRLVYGLIGAFTAIAIAGFEGLDSALAALTFVLFPVRLAWWAWLLAAVGVSGTASFLFAQWVPGFEPLLFPFHNRNHYAVFCELSLPVLVFAWRRGGNSILLFAGGLMVITALLAGSRVGAVLLLVECCALWIISVERNNRWIALPCALLCASLFVSNSGTQRLANPLDGDHRLQIWQSGIEMVLAKPWIGWGANEFSRGYPAFAKFDNGEIVNAAHSDWLEWCIEYGCPIGIAWFAMFIWWLRKSIRSYPSWGILVGALHALVDYPFHLPGFLVFAAALAGSVHAYGNTVEAKSTDSKRRDSRIPLQGRIRDLSCRTGDVAEREVGLVGHGPGTGL